MAGNVYVKKRLWNPDLIVDPTGLLPNSLKQDIDGKHHASYTITWTGTTQAGEELGTAPDSAKDGTVTPYQITVVSSQATDIDTDVGKVRAVALIGITTVSLAAYAQWLLDPTTVAGYAGRPQSTVEVVLMNGTTDVLSTRWFIWTDHAYAVNWGSGGADAEGDITIESPANTDLLTIKATYNESNGGRWHFVPDKQVRIHHVHISPGEAFAAATGVILKATWTKDENVMNSDPDLNVDYFIYLTPSLSAQYHKDHISRYTTLSSQCLWSETTVTAAKIQYINIHQIVS